MLSAEDDGEGRIDCQELPVQSFLSYSNKFCSKGIILWLKFIVSRVVIHAYNPGTKETKLGETRVQGKAGFAVKENRPIQLTICVFTIHKL